jgi:hypothetical protein
LERSLHAFAAAESAELLREVFYFNNRRHDGRNSLGRALAGHILEPLILTDAQPEQNGMAGISRRGADPR